MKADGYTKVVLTIIAACLVWLCIRGTTITPVSAQSPQEVVLVGVRGARTILAVRPTGDWYETALPVEAPRPLAARIVGLERAGAARWDAVDVNVREQPRKATPGH
jgi:hypothetical protein